ncbi:M56 family metallopeptidase [Thermomonospora cellulosilytica]|uniref:Zn-dependent protease with chaperone function n=1 Tax=Thermomonospora cellulosilytica TaxID=1411118 RepID=A0A7W3R719_9ACTN|nr:M56 family metallopeptidase [Thermomonospora cellulosilytica]MBA9002803.1 Zn-dependent protease with chaperone function [Thermomonospora cellulosilytica]
MIAALVLLLYALALGLLGPRLLTRSSWSDRAPRLGVLAWQAATASVLVAVVLAGLALVVPIGRAAHNLADLFHVCQMMLQSGYGGALQPIGAFVGLAMAGGAVLWTGGHVIHALVTTARHRRRHAEMLAVLARRRPDLDALIIDHDQPLAYCLAGRHRCVVLTTGALERLHDDQLAAVLAHERAHLRGRHDLAVNLAVAISRAFPGVPLFGRAREEITRLVELLADDAAARRHDRVSVAAALVTLAEGRVPAVALGAGGHTAVFRVHRMLAPHRPLSRTARVAGHLGVALLIVVPLLIAVNPAVMAMLAEHCHLSL